VAVTDIHTFLKFIFVAVVTGALHACIMQDVML